MMELGVVGAPASYHAKFHGAVGGPYSGIGEGLVNQFFLVGFKYFSITTNALDKQHVDALLYDTHAKVCDIGRVGGDGNGSLRKEVALDNCYLLNNWSLNI